MVDVTSMRVSIHVHLYYMFSYLLCNHIQIIILDMQSLLYTNLHYTVYIYIYTYNADTYCIIIYTYILCRYVLTVQANILYSNVLFM